MVFIPHVAHAAIPKRDDKPKPPGGKNSGGNWAAPIMVAVTGGVLGPVFAAVLGGIHGDMAAALVILVLGCAGLGFGVGKAIGRQS